MSGFSNHRVSCARCEHEPRHDWKDRAKCVRLRVESENHNRKRSKQVFDTGEIPHLWAHRAQDSARNAQRNLYFENEVIYSYGSHFPIARHVENKKGKRAVLLTTARYSVTTSGHISAVSSAIPPTVPVFNVPYVLAGTKWAEPHSKNLQAFRTDMESALIAAARAKSSGNKEWFHGRALRLRTEHNAYIIFFGLRNKSLPAVPRLDSKALGEIKKRESIKAAQKAEQTRKDRAAALVRQAEHIAKWRAGEESGNFYDVPTMLRVVGDEVETSRGARVPISHAKRALVLVRALVSRGEAWQSNGHTCHVGHYQLDRIEADGTLKAGCHVIPRREWERIAPALDVLLVTEQPEA
jgi:hypothetical protein